MARILDVAKLAGVSTATVSRTFNEPHLIHPDTQRKVREAAERLHYLPRRLRSTEVRARQPTRLSGAIGFQFFAAQPSDMLLSNTFYAHVLAGALSEASALGLHLLVHTTDRHGLSQELPRMVEERAVDGLLLVGTADAVILKMLAHHVPEIVLVDNRDVAGAYDCVLSDGFGGAYAATCSLIERGHRSIEFFGYEEGVTTFQDRLRGYWCAHLEKGVALDPSRVINVVSKPKCEEQLATLLQSRNRPTALVCSNDHYASDAIRVCRQLGLKIPSDISVIGFDDTAFAHQADPPLSTVRVDKELMGRLAVRRLHARLNRLCAGGTPEAPEHTVTPVYLVLRQSCRAI
jgi:DNA-binding LacI/PurR family transcriptional regulator